MRVIHGDCLKELKELRLLTDHPPQVGRGAGKNTPVRNRRNEAFMSRAASASLLLLLASAMTQAAAPPARAIYPVYPVVLPEGYRPADPLWYSWESTSGGTYALYFRGRQIGWLDRKGLYYPAVARRGLYHFGPASEAPVALPGKGVGQ